MSINVEINKFPLSTWGVWVTNGGLKDFPNYPPSKKVYCNDWHESDWKEALLSEQLMLGAQNIILEFASETVAEMDAFATYLNSVVVCIFVVGGNSKILRYVKNSSIRHLGGVCVSRFDFIQDSMYIYNASLPDTTKPATGMTMDGNDMKIYSLIVLDDTFGNMLRYPSMKNNLVINSEYENGQIVDTSFFTYAKDTVTINLCMMASSDDFWSFYNKLIYDLTRQHERVIAYKGYTMHCFYKSCNTIQFFIGNGLLGWKFRLTFSVISSVKDVFEFEWSTGICVKIDELTGSIYGHSWSNGVCAKQQQTPVYFYEHSWSNGICAKHDDSITFTYAWSNYVCAVNRQGDNTGYKRGRTLTVTQSTGTQTYHNIEDGFTYGGTTYPDISTAGRVTLANLSEDEYQNRLGAFCAYVCSIINGEYGSCVNMSQGASLIDSQMCPLR